LNDTAFRQLKESKYYFPEVTDVILDSNMMLEMVSHSISITEKGYDTVIDSVMFKFLLKYFQHGINLIDKRVEEKGIKTRMVIDANKDNIDIINSIKHYEIKHIDGIRGNFGIFDNRAYMVFIFHKESDQPDQTLWSNSKALVDKQQIIFNKLWEIAIPLSARQKELEYEEYPNYQKTLTKILDIQNEIISLIEQTRKELLIFSSTSILTSVFQENNFVKRFSCLLKKDVNIRILIDDVNLDVIRLIREINKENVNNPIQFGYTNRLGKIDSFTILNDGKLMLQAKSNDNQDLVASLSNEQHKIVVQEILFEKHWNEIQSLSPDMY
jgi:hypothetical protein